MGYRRILKQGWKAVCGRPLFATKSGIYAPIAFALVLICSAAFASIHHDKDGVEYGAGLIVNIPVPEPEVAQVVEEISQNTIIRGTKEYNKDEYVKGAEAASSTNVFPAWTEGGRVFYKIRKHAIDPRNFKDAGDAGTLAVRYVVQPQGESNTVLRIDAIFVEEFRHRTHLSNGSVEGGEYKDIQDRLQAVELVKKETAEALREKEERQAKRDADTGAGHELLGTPPPAADTSQGGRGDSFHVASTATPVVAGAADDTPDSLKQHLADLRRQVERTVKKPGAPLKSAPFHTASTLRALEPGTEVLIVITTPYWYGIETHEGEHGWLQRDELEQLP